jgi:hypothetical protein
VTSKQHAQAHELCAYLMVLASCSTGCLQATNAQLSCPGSSGSSAQAVMPRNVPQPIEGLSARSFDDYLSSADQQILTRTTGVGGILAWGTLPEGNQTPFMDSISEDAGDRPAEQGRSERAGLFRSELNQCTVHLSRLNDSNSKAIIWTSLNCINWAEVSSKTSFWLSVDNRTKAVQVVPDRMLWDKTILNTLGRAHAEFAPDMKQTIGTQGPHSTTSDATSLASAANFDRFVVTLNGDVKIISTIIKNLNTTHDARSKALGNASQQIKKFLKDWIERTESQTVFRTLSAFASENCSLSKSANKPPICTNLLQGIEAEYNAVTDLFRHIQPQSGSNNQRLELKSFDRFIEELNNVAKKYSREKNPYQQAAQMDSFHRKKTFADLLNWLASGAKQPSADDNWSELNFGFGKSNVLFVHAMITLTNNGNEEESKSQIGNSVYQALPLDVLFNSNALNVLALRNQTYEPSKSPKDFAGLSFKSPAHFVPQDEGAMISFQGYYPMAFLMHSSVTMGKSEAQELSVGTKKRATTYNSGSCR